MKLYLFAILFFSQLLVQAQDTTRVTVDLNDIGNKVVSVRVYPPTEKTAWEYVIPEVIPGTYMKVNYVRFFDRPEAFDLGGNKARVKRSKNVFSISGKNAISHLSYTVKPTLEDQKVWDNILLCGGSAFKSECALFNFQVINGYFEGFEKQPFKIEVNKPTGFFGASSMKKASSSENKDVLVAGNYFELIDQPILYSKADTSSFRVGDNRFHIAVYAESGNVSSELLRPRFDTLMQEIDSYSGFTSADDYWFLVYLADPNQGKGLFKDFGKGSALEHKHSSVYYNEDITYDSTFSFYSYVGAHEYFHTITPLSLHSEKIAEFNFRKADMSRHVWMYEGVTDYLAMLLQVKSGRGRSSSQLAFATQSAMDRSRQSMTESGRDIIARRNIFSAINKFKDVANFYEKGKLIAFAMDMELDKRSNGERRLLDAMLVMQRDFKDKPFDDTELLSILEKYTYPGFELEFKPFIEGTELPAYETYFEQFGWTFYDKKAKLPSYGRFYLRKNRKSKQFYVWKKKSNELGFSKGDTILAVNNIPFQELLDTKGAYHETFNIPKLDDHVTVQVKRKGKVVELAGSPKLHKLRYPRMRINPDRTEAQEAFLKRFFNLD